MQNIIIDGIIGVMLGACSIQDIIHKKINTWLIVAGGLLLVLTLLILRPISITESLSGLPVGVLVMAISKATGGKIGMGDGMVLCVTGLWLGLWGNMELFAYALLAAAIVSVVLLALRLVNRKKSIPFIPFLLLGYLIILLTKYKA